MIFRLIAKYLFWVSYWAFEARHDWQAAKYLFQTHWTDTPSLEQYNKRKIEWKLFDTGMHVSAICIFAFYEAYMTGSMLWTVNVALFDWWSGWILHDLFYSKFSSTVFGKFGTTAVPDNIMNSIIEKYNLSLKQVRWLLISPLIFLALTLLIQGLFFL